jgi:lysine/ornithine N-monooxygenase
MCADQAPTVVYDLIGVGFGPANVALAGALLEKWEPLTVTVSHHGTMASTCS